MRVLLSTYGSRGDVEPKVGSRCGCGHAAADLPPRAAELVAAQFDTVAAAAEGRDALAAGGMMPAGVRR
jgi:hypothetical protein